MQRPLATRADARRRRRPALHHARQGRRAGARLRSTRPTSGPTVIVPRGAARAPCRTKPGLGARSSLAAAVLLACLTVGSASAAVMWFANRPVETPQATPLQHDPRRQRSCAGARTAVVAPRLLPQSSCRARARQAGPRSWAARSRGLAGRGSTLRATSAGPSRRRVQNVRRGTLPIRRPRTWRVCLGAVRLDHLNDARGSLSPLPRRAVPFSAGSHH